MCCSNNKKLTCVLNALLPSIKQMGLASDAPVWKEGPIRLHLNENPSPVPREISDVLFAAVAKINQYPDMDGTTLRDVAAKTYSLTKDHVIAADGSVEILGLLYKAFLSKGDIASMLAPGFTLNRKFAQMQEAHLMEVKLREDYSFPLEELIEVSHKSKFILIANPNNPTGTFGSTSTIEALLNSVSCLVVIDEAYADFASENVLHLVQKHPHLLVLRSFSKSYSMAGLRVGLGFGHPDIMRCLRRIQNEFSLNAVGQLAAIEALKRKDIFLKNIQKICTQRERLFQILLNQGFVPIPSHANFVFAQTPDRTNGDFWRKKLEEKNILITSFNEKSLNNFIRISVGTDEQMACVEKVLMQIKEENKGIEKEPSCI